MSSPAIPDPLPPNDNRGPNLLAVYWVQTGISIVVVALRFYVRYAKRIIGVEDWAMLGCLMLYTVGSSLLPVLIHYGIGRHIYYVQPEDLAQVLRWNWIIQPFGIMAQPFGKVSVSIFLLGLMGPKATFRKWFLYINMGLFTLCCFLQSVFTYVQCNPPRALWEKVPGAKCWNPDIQADTGIAFAAYGAAYDFALCLLPVTILWNLQMDIKRKIVLYILLGFSVFSGISATAKTVQLRELAVRVDVTWDTFSLYAWSSTELFVNIVGGSMPMLKPLYDKWSTGRPLSQDSYERSGATSARKVVGSRESNASSSKFPWSWKSTASTAVSSNRSKSGGVEEESRSSKEQIMIVQSFDVHSNNESMASSEVVSREMREV